jgi:hypothetical protein
MAKPATSNGNTGDAIVVGAIKGTAIVLGSFFIGVSVGGKRHGD